MLEQVLQVAPPEHIAHALADEITALVRARASQGRTAVLALPAGSTPLATYAELARRRREEGVSFQGVVVFGLDEYLGLPSSHPRSFRRFFQRELFEPLGIPAENARVLEGDLHPGQVEAHCRDYERAIQRVGGLDLALLGLGRNGHLAFNEPGSPRDSRTRRVELHATTRERAAPDFGGLEAVPLEAVTMGLGTLREARAVRLVATGASKRAALAGALGCRRPAPEHPATWLAGHPDLRIWCDAEARREGGDPPQS